MAEKWGTHAVMDMATSQAVDECLKCHRVCVDTASRCLMLGGEYARADLLRILMDCAQMCQTSADFLLRKSEFAPHISELCEEICERCAGVCGQFDDPLMLRCKQTCRRTAAACCEAFGAVYPS